jgi:hypothetical protein
MLDSIMAIHCRRFPPLHSLHLRKRNDIKAHIYPIFTYHGTIASFMESQGGAVQVFCFVGFLKYKARR